MSPYFIERGWTDAEGRTHCTTPRGVEVREPRFFRPPRRRGWRATALHRLRRMLGLGR